MSGPLLMEVKRLSEVLVGSGLAFDRGSRQNLFTLDKDLMAIRRTYIFGRMRGDDWVRNYFSGLLDILAGRAIWLIDLG